MKLYIYIYYVCESESEVGLFCPFCDVFWMICSHLLAYALQGSFNWFFVLSIIVSNCKFQKLYHVTPLVPAWSEAVDLSTALLKTWL